MVTIERDVWIDAQPEQVFEYLADPENHPNVMPSLQRVENIEALPNGGHKGEFRFKMVGVPVTGRFEDTEYVPNELRAYEMTGDTEGSMRYSVAPKNGGTHVTCVLDATFPSRVLDTVLRPVAKRYNEREIETMLGNLKTVMETERKTLHAA